VKEKGRKRTNLGKSLVKREKYVQEGQKTKAKRCEMIKYCHIVEWEEKKIFFLGGGLFL
jgi:hypothetical protein